MIVALQYHAGDLDRTMSLARLLADVEAKPRPDVLLALVCQPGTSRPEVVARTVAHCRLKFAVEEIVSEYGAKGSPEGCTALWRGTVSHFFRKYQSSGNAVDPGGQASILTLDGGDGVPLHADWLDRIIVLHGETLRRGKLITGTPHFLGTCPLHVNPNAVFHLDVFGKTKLLTDVPVYDGTMATHFDIYHREEMLANACLSSAIRTDWRGGGLSATRDLLLDRSMMSLWLHGFKDENLYWAAREHLVSCPQSPRIRDYDVDQLHVQENVRRSFEASQERVPAARVHSVLKIAVQAEVQHTVDKILPASLPVPDVRVVVPVLATCPVNVVNPGNFNIADKVVGTGLPRNVNIS
jgi:hypothetical protein